MVAKQTNGNEGEKEKERKNLLAYFNNRIADALESSEIYVIKSAAAAAGSLFYLAAASCNI